MKNIYYMVRNASGSDGQFYLDGRYYFIAAGQTITLTKKPINTTANVVVSVFRKETFDTEPHKIPVNVVHNRKGNVSKKEEPKILEKDKHIKSVLIEDITTNNEPKEEVKVEDER